MWLLVLACLTAGAADGGVEELARLRAEIEALSYDLSMEEESLRGRLRSLEAVRTDLEVQVRAEDLGARTLRDDLAELAAGAATESGHEDVLTPAVRHGLDTLRAAIEAGLPYRVAERLAAVDALRTQLDTGALPPARVASRLWQLAEDELRLTRENALDRQTVSVEGAEVLADVVRLGMVALYVRTPDGQYGFAERDGGGWRTTMLTGRTPTQQIASLFDSVGKQIRVGYFELPNALETR